MTRDKDKKPGKEQQLLEAARLGHVDQLETLLNQFQQLKTKKRSNPLASLRKCIGPNTIRDPVTGFTCLHHAALNGHSRAVQVIVNYGGRLNAVDYKGSTALHLAAWSGNLQVVKTLTSHLSAPNATSELDGYRSSSLSVSSEAYAASAIVATTSTTTSLDTSRTLSVAQIKSSSPKLGKPTSQRQQQAASPDSVGNCCAKQQQTLDIDHRNNDNQTALSLAAQFGHSQVASELLAQGANPNLRNNQLESPLDLASLNGHLATVRVLLDSSPVLVKDLRQPHSTISISTYPFSHVQSVPHDHDHDHDHDQDNYNGAADNPATQVKRHPSVSGWSSLLRGTTMKDLSPTSDRFYKVQRRATMAPCGRQASKQQMELELVSQQNNSPIVSERLLDHSPLHYAVRRGHSPIVDLMLTHYEANIYQLTSLGSVMHELVMGNHSFRDATSRGSSNGVKHYPHSDIIRLFLTYLNRMSAGDVNETNTRWQHLLSARNGQQRNIFDMLNDINNRHAQELHKAILDTSEHLKHNLNSQGQKVLEQPLNWLGQQQKQQQLQQQQVFTQSHHLNSFVTMKRVPKQRPLELTRTIDNEFRVDQPQEPTITSDGTQTIGRRKMLTKSKQQSADTCQFDYRTRPISSLGPNTNPATAYQSSNLERPLTINWPELSGRPNARQAQAQAQHQDQMLDQNPQAARKKRSKSRDLGTILNDHQVNLNSNSSIIQEQLYDNQLLPSMGQQQQQQQQVSSNHLVRSQTDCTHLLGRFFNQQHEHRKQALPRLGPCNQSSDDDRLHGAASLTRQHYYQQENHHAHSSENSSLISGLDHQERLVPSSIAQQHSATLDRRAINRHYHVYEHEFYPPRLVTAPHQTQGNKSAASNHNHHHHHVSGRSKQMVAIVPPLVHNLVHSIDGARRLPPPPPPPLPPVEAQLINNSRLSLNIEHDISQRQISAHVGQQDQRGQMDRFLGRSTRKSMGCQLSNGNGGVQQNVGSANMGPSYEQQSRQSSLMPRPQSMHSSQSLESRLGGGASFESTRHALMRDFDQMIGRELLNTNNKYSDHSSDGGQSNNSRRLVNSTSSSSQNSILTGVSLDMDTRGEHLIVTGTRITMPEMQDMRAGATSTTTTTTTTKVMNQSISSGSVKSSPPSNRASQRISPRISSAQSAQMSIGAAQTGSDSRSQSSLASSAEHQNKREGPPRKPPRPSLESQQIYKALQMGARTMSSSSDPKHRGNAVIYDVPSHNNSLSNLAECAPGSRRPGSRTSVNSGTALMATSPLIGARGPPARPPQPRPRRGGAGNEIAGDQQHQVSITQPPIERPPPPPPPPPHVPLVPAQHSSSPPISPLEEITVAPKHDRLDGPAGSSLKLSLSSSSSCNSPTSSISSSFKLPTNHLNLLDSNVGNSTSEQEARINVQVAGYIMQVVESGDSGVCTGNSPASTSHDSEIGHPQLGELSLVSSRVYSKPKSRSGSVILGPPSPRTAQMSIEEAFMPLEQTTTQEAANQTINQIDSSFSSDNDDEPDSGSANTSCVDLEQEIEQASSFELGSQVDEIFGWLGSTNKSQLESHRNIHVDAPPSKAGYENCIELQDRLRDSRCRSIGDLFRAIANESHNLDELSNCSQASSGSSIKLTAAQTCSSEEGDYAITSEPRRGVDQVESSSANNSSLSLEPHVAVDDDEDNLEWTKSIATLSSQCKEIMVRVVVDESQKESNGEDVFYINPIELKRISSKVGMSLQSANKDVGQRSEAATLTEEELCASVDQNSGLIRFTLRKRRGTGAGPNLPPTPLRQTHKMPVASLPPEVSEMAGSKRTKMITDNNEEEGQKCGEVESTSPAQIARPSESQETMQHVIVAEEETKQSQGVSLRKASGDSISMDTSQVSSSSSTSEMSIKSIVSLRIQQPTQCSSIDTRTLGQMPSNFKSLDDEPTTTVTDNVESSATQYLREQTPTLVGVAQPEPPRQAVAEMGVDEQVKQVKRLTPVVSKVASSLVGETARKLEAAAAARATTSGPLPAALARRTLNNGNNLNGEKLICDKENKPKPPALPPKKSICWPPKKLTDDNYVKPADSNKSDPSANDEITMTKTKTKTTTSTPTGPIIGRVSANRLSFQRLIEERDKTATAANTTLNRPKPPPPAKPAGLIVPQSFKS